MTPSSSETSRRERRRQETLEKLFLAAIELFATKGFVETKVEDITEAADVGKGTFFNYFPSKHHVLGYFAGRQLATVERYLAMSREGEIKSEKLLSELARDLTRLPTKSPEMARTIVASFLADAEVREYILRSMGDGRRMIGEMVQLGQQRGELRSDMDPEELARIFQQSLFGTIMMWSLQPKTPVANMRDNTLEVLLRGICNSGGKRKPQGRRSVHREGKTR